MKAVFQKLGAEVWGHSVAHLLEELPEEYAYSEEIMNAALELDKAYIPTRYPNAHPSGAPRSRYTREEVQRLITNAEKIFEFSKSILSELHQG